MLNLTCWKSNGYASAITFTSSHEADLTNRARQHVTPKSAYICRLPPCKGVFQSCCPTAGSYSRQLSKGLTKNTSKTSIAFSPPGFTAVIDSREQKQTTTREIHQYSSQQMEKEPTPGPCHREDDQNSLSARRCSLGLRQKGHDSNMSHTQNSRVGGKGRAGRGGGTAAGNHEAGIQMFHWN